MLSSEDSISTNQFYMALNVEMSILSSADSICTNQFYIVFNVNPQIILNAVGWNN